MKIPIRFIGGRVEIPVQRIVRPKAESVLNMLQSNRVSSFEVRSLDSFAQASTITPLNS